MPQLVGAEAVRFMAAALMGATDLPHEASIDDSGQININLTGPQVSPDVVGPPVPVAPVRATDALQKAQTIGASRPGERYASPSVGDALRGPYPLWELAKKFVVGEGRPSSVAAQDPYGITAWEQGAGSPPALMMGSTTPEPPAMLTLRDLAKGSPDQLAKVIRQAQRRDMTVKEATAILGRLADKFPALAEDIKTGRVGEKRIAQEMRTGLGTLADTLAPGGKTDPYRLRPSVIARLAHFFELGGGEATANANWEGGLNQDLINAFGGDADAAHTYARIWAAATPGTSVPRTTGESISAWLHAVEHPGEPMTVEQARTMNPKITMAGSKVPNINRALAGERLGGEKVEAMAGFMVGEPRTPVDVHALYGVGSEHTDLGPEWKFLRDLMRKREGRPTRGAERLTENDLYTRYEGALQDALKSFDPKWDVNPIFAQTWEGIRAGKGLKAQGGPIDILRKKGLLEYGAMLDPAQLIRALSSKGWTAGAIAGLLAVLHQQAPAAPARSAPAGAGTADGPPAP